MNQAVWRKGHQFELLENGEAYYPDLFQAIDAARDEILLETFILFDDPVGQQLNLRLATAARRGCRVDFTVDGYGSHGLPGEFIAHMTDAGVRLHVYDPQPTVLGIRTNLFRRLHRKLVVVDGKLGYIGGINYSVEQLITSGPASKQDYALKVTGPVVDDIRDLMLEFIRTGGGARRGQSLLKRWRQRWRKSMITDPTDGRGAGQAALLVRDNDAHRQDIELGYRAMIRSAQSEIIIANAYFLPGLRLLRELRSAARRGVSVHLILQGNGDWSLLEPMTQSLYEYLISAGVIVHEYCRRPMHGKVAVVDGSWSTVGSSNLDPLSLLLNLEANLFVHDDKLGRGLRDHLMHLVKTDCQTLNATDIRRHGLWRRMLLVVLFHVLRRFPYWSAGWLPGHAARLHAATSSL